MKPAPFTLHRPATTEQALALLAEVSEEGGLILAGGQSLVPMMALRVAYPPHLVDINGIAELGLVRDEDGRRVIGALARHAFFHTAAEGDRLGALMAAVSRHIAHYPIRMRGTFCGSLAHADPASEWCLVAATLDARIHLATVAERRVVAAADFFASAMTTVRQPDEMIVGASLPVLPAETAFGFCEFNRRAGDFALGMSLVTYRIEGGLMAGVRIGLGGVEETPRRIRAAEAILEGRSPDDGRFRGAAAAAAADVEPMEDATTTSEYRRDLAAVVVRRALESAQASLQNRN